MNKIQMKFQAAKDLISKGWIQRAMHGDGSFCLVGAVDRVSGADYGHMQEILINTIKVNDLKYVNYKPNNWFVFSSTDFITRWNDNKARTKDQVLDIIDKAIADSAKVG